MTSVQQLSHPNFLGEFQRDLFTALTLLLINSSRPKTDRIDLPGLELNPCNLCCSNVLQRRLFTCRICIHWQAPENR